MMRNNFLFALLLAIIVTNNAPSADAQKKDENKGRIFFSTFTVILSTVTSFTTIASTTSCTTSTSALATCSVGRRRRGLFYDDAENQGRARRGLFYNDDEDENNNLSLIAKRFVVNHEEESVSTSKVTIDDKKWIPLTIESGFNLPDGFPSEAARFKLAYGTSTVTSTSTIISTRSLTATCASTTSFQICSGAGK